MAEDEGTEKSEQLKIMRQMLDQAIERTRLAVERTAMSEDRSRMSADRSRMSEDRSRMSEERSRMSEDRSRLSEDRSRMSEDRSRMSAERSEMSAQRCYMNAERTLSVWVRTSLSLMIFGIAIARFELVLMEAPQHGAQIEALSNWTGIAMIAFGILMSLSTGARFLAYVAEFRRNHSIPKHHGPYLAPLFAVLVALFGIALLIMMLIFAG